VGSSSRRSEKKKMQWVGRGVRDGQGGALALSGSLPGGRAKGASCVQRPFLTSDVVELRVPQVRCLPLCISRVRSTYKCLALCEGLGDPRPLIFASAICATHAQSSPARSIVFCAMWVCISSSSSSDGLTSGRLERRILVVR
jgi:hypothetical protein